MLDCNGQDTEINDVTIRHHFTYNIRPSSASFECPFFFENIFSHAVFKLKNHVVGVLIFYNKEKYIILEQVSQSNDVEVKLPSFNA